MYQNSMSGSISRVSGLEYPLLKKIGSLRFKQITTFCVVKKQFKQVEIK